MGVTLIGFQSASLLGAASIIVNPCMFCYRAGHSLAGRDNRRPSLKLLSLHLPPPATAFFFRGRFLPASAQVPLSGAAPQPLTLQNKRKRERLDH